MNAKLFFSADYRDGRVRIVSKTYSAGYYCVHLLNQYYKDDTAARISVFTNRNWQLQEQLNAGYLNASDFAKAGDEICNIFHVLPWLKPFDALDIKAERNRVVNLFTSENAEMLISYFRRRAAVGNMDEGQVLLHLLPPEYDKAFFEQAEGLLTEVRRTLQFYDRIGADIRKAFTQLVRFVEYADEAERLDEAHLLPMAMDIFGELPLPVTTEYVPYKKNAKSKTEVVARRLFIDSYYSFIITDFFEALHYGH